MSKITRCVQKIFGSTAAANQRSKFGSLAAGSPAFATTPIEVQELSNFLDGWFGGVMGGNSPAIEDMNGLCFLYAYQLAYLMQQGVAEWDAQTTYYIGSAVNVAGEIYISLTDDNLNNATTDVTKWKNFRIKPYSTITGNTTLGASHETVICNSASDIDVTLPTNLNVGKEYRIKNINTGVVNIIGTVDGSTTTTIGIQYDSLNLIFAGGSAWYTI